MKNMSHTQELIARHKASIKESKVEISKLNDSKELYKNQIKELKAQAKELKAQAKAEKAEAKAQYRAEKQAERDYAKELKAQAKMSKNNK